MPHIAPRSSETPAPNGAGARKKGSTPSENGSSKTRRSAEKAVDRSGLLREETRELPEVRKMLSQGQQQGFLTVEEVRDVLPAAQASEERVAVVRNMVDELGIRVVPSRKPPSSARRVASRRNQSMAPPRRRPRVPP